jgi:3-mercaptopyruvate sulfurtransferase SseA
MSETAQRGGHIPGAKSIPWSTAVNPTNVKIAGRSRIDLSPAKGVDRNRDTIAHCRIGERSSHTSVRPEISARIEQREKLRRELDGAWQHRRRTDREVARARQLQLNYEP